MNEAEGVPVCGLANDLSWAEERSAMALTNYVPHAQAEAAWIARLGAGRIVSCPGDDSSTSTEEEEVWHRAPTLPQMQTLRWGMRVRMEWEGRLTLEMQRKETGGGTLRIGKP